MDGWMDGWMDGEREGGKDGGREGRVEGGRDGGREGGRDIKGEGRERDRWRGVSLFQHATIDDSISTVCTMDS